jgi:hypothetical protein
MGRLALQPEAAVADADAMRRNRCDEIIRLIDQVLADSARSTARPSSQAPDANRDDT